MSHAFIEHLKEDHKKQRAIGEQIKAAAEPSKLQRLRTELYDELYPHMIGEEHSIFEHMREAGDEEAKEHALEAIQEHHVAKILLRELLEMKTDSETFKPKATVLDEVNRHHTEEEESNHFVWLETHASSEELDQLFARYEDAEEKAKKG
jgi:hypothetical protein